jgi:hypothetical protein
MPKHNNGDGGGDYGVGYGKPPKHSQFKSGQSGNPNGAPRKQNREMVDVAATLSEPIAVKKEGKSHEMQPFEASMRSLVRRGLNDGDLGAILKFLENCEKYGVIKPRPEETGGGVIQAPKGVDFNEWFAEVTELVPETSAEEADEYDDY